MMHGYGTCVWEPGARYDGCWAHGDRHGWGMMMYPDGTVVAGRWMYDELRWRSTLWLRDGKRCFVGDWNSVRVPVKGAMMEANGDVYYAENKDKLRSERIGATSAEPRMLLAPRLLFATSRPVWKRGLGSWTGSPAGPPAGLQPRPRQPWRRAPEATRRSLAKLLTNDAQTGCTPPLF